MLQNLSQWASRKLFGRIWGGSAGSGGFGEDTGGISGAPGGNLGRIWGESGGFREDTGICGVDVLCMCVVFLAYIPSLAGASPLAVPASYL